MNSVEIVWENVLLLSFYHVLALHGIHYLITFQTYLGTFLWVILLGQISSLGVYAGIHRLWSHRAYKAKLTLRIFLMFCSLVANQYSIFTWARDHRVHHKYVDTDADPHNINRGFFFAHMGWLMCRKDPEVVTKGKSIDISDLENDSVVMFQRKYFYFLAPLISFVIATIIPCYCWGEDWHIALCTGMFRYVYTLHGTWLINSVAHTWGMKPYDQNIKPTENMLVSHVTGGEGWHNYHHVFAWDYKASELGSYNGNMNTAFIDLMSKINMAYDLRSATPAVIQMRKLKHGDKSTRLQG